MRSDSWVSSCCQNITVEPSALNPKSGKSCSAFRCFRLVDKALHSKPRVSLITQVRGLETEGFIQDSRFKSDASDSDLILSPSFSFCICNSFFLCMYLKVCYVSCFECMCMHTLYARVSWHSLCQTSTDKYVRSRTWSAMPRVVWEDHANLMLYISLFQARYIMFI